jgi:hypothetical protein
VYFIDEKALNMGLCQAQNKKAATWVTALNVLIKGKYFIP